MWFTLICVLVLRQVIAQENDYLEQSRQSCLKNKSSFSCGKYRILKYVKEISEPTRKNTLGSLGPVSLVSLPSSREPPELFSSSEPRLSSNEWDKFHRFVLKQMDTFVTHHGVTIQVGTSEFGDDSPKLVDLQNTGRDLSEEFEGRAKKKKRLALLLPLLMFFKLKALIVPILLSVLFIKKLLIIAAVLIPSLFSMVKYCKASPSVHTYHTSEFSAGPAGDYSEPYDHPYYKDYNRRSQNLAYRGYSPTAGT